MPNVQKKAKTIMLQGTASDVGKSILTTAICRILKQDGWQVAPYKSQNMALNSYVTLDGKEIGRAQGVQAEACGIAATTDMNPILIKPMKDMNSQIVVHGKPYTQLSARDYRKEFLPVAQTTVVEALERLRSEYDVVVIEGAGSPAEINLKQNDIVNMRLAAWADAPVLLVADIDRGGVFASLVGTLELLEPHERERVKGFIINKFRGDLGLLEPGLTWLEERTGIPVIGVLPYLPNIEIEQEDSVVLDQLKELPDTSLHTQHALGAKDMLDIAVVRYPRISNFTDIDPFTAEPDVRVRYVRTAAELGQPDCVILPGTKNTIDDLRYLRETGLADALAAWMSPEAGKERPTDRFLAGICGGYQMLGQLLRDPEGVEMEGGAEAEGLGYLPLQTVFYAEKKTERVEGMVRSSHRLWQAWNNTPIHGYEIHMGQTTVVEQPGDNRESAALFHLQEVRTGSCTAAAEGLCSADGRVFGTYVHGIFHNDEFRRQWLNMVRCSKGLKPIEEIVRFEDRQQVAFDRLAEEARKSLNLSKIYEIVGLETQCTSPLL